MKRRDLFKNVLSGFGGQFIVIVLGIIIPRIMISIYGSDVNGVVATTTQIFSYLALLESGIGQSARVALYKPIADNDFDEISKVYYSAESYFKKATLFYAVGVILLSAVAPFLIKTEMSHFTILLVFLLEGMSGVVNFNFVQTPITLLNADGKGYVNNIINLANKSLGYIAKIVLALLGFNIVYVQLSYFIIVVLKSVVYRFYLRKNYPWLEIKSKPDSFLLKDKNAFLITEIAWTIFSSTDIIVLSMLVSTKLSSVYSIYNMIYSNINLLLNAVGGSVIYLLGQIYHRNIKEYEIAHDSFNTIFISAITILMSVCYFLTIPFIKIYTRGFDDANYIYPELPMLFSLVQMMSWCRYVTGNLTGIAGYAKATSYISLAEAILNVALSVILVQRFGIVGALFATVIALPIKVIWCIYISDKKVLNRSYLKTIVTMGVNFGFFFLVGILTKYIDLNITSYARFALYGCALTVVISLVVFGMNILINRNCWSVVKKYLLKR